MQSGPLTRQAMAAVVTYVTINLTVNMVTVVTMVTMFICCSYENAPEVFIPGVIS